MFLKLQSDSGLEQEEDANIELTEQDLEIFPVLRVPVVSCIFLFVFVDPQQLLH